MSTARDELTHKIAVWAMAGELAGPTADVLWAAGWRKMPSADTLADFIADQRDQFPRVADDMDSGDLADAILALMEGSDG
jgi:hypothetical protein